MLYQLAESLAKQEPGHVKYNIKKKPCHIYLKKTSNKGWNAKQLKYRHVYQALTTMINNKGKELYKITLALK